jgi:hypothetical protein
MSERLVHSLCLPGLFPVERFHFGTSASLLFHHALIEYTGTGTIHCTSTYRALKGMFALSSGRAWIILVTFVVY